MRTITFEVEQKQHLFRNLDSSFAVIRKVKVPVAEMSLHDKIHNLELIFKYGQNDFQPIDNRCSVSVGDVIRFACQRWEVDFVGFKKI